MPSIIDQVRKIVINECQKSRYTISPFPAYSFHIQVVEKYSILLAKKLKANLEITQLGALLHDIGMIKHGKNNHELTGVSEAQKILNNLNYPKNKINRVSEIIRSHRGSKDIPPETLEAKIVANADAMAHYDILPALMEVALRENHNDGVKSYWWLYDKIERNWQKKLTIPYAREMMKEKYQAIKTVLDSMREYVK